MRPAFPAAPHRIRNFFTNVTFATDSLSSFMNEALWQAFLLKVGQPMMRCKERSRTEMLCTQYRELQRRCDSKRKIMSHFMRYKPADWQADPSARSFAKETQTEILRLAAEMDMHRRNCAICERKSDQPPGRMNNSPATESNGNGVNEGQ